MTIVVGFVPTKEGRAALAARWRKRRRADRGSSSSTPTAGVVTSTTSPARRPRPSSSGSQDELSGDGLELEVRQLVRGNEPAEDLIAVANETDADLIVIGLRRRTPVGKLILGSNAQRILLDAPCAVLAVKG